MRTNHRVLQLCRRCPYKKRREDVGKNTRNVFLYTQSESTRNWRMILCQILCQKPLHITVDTVTAQATKLIIVTLIIFIDVANRWLFRGATCSKLSTSDLKAYHRNRMLQILQHVQPDDCQAIQQSCCVLNS